MKRERAIPRSGERSRELARLCKMVEVAAARFDASPRAKQDRSRERNRLILDAAIYVFARDGVSKGKIIDIGKRAGVPISSIYEYYRDKEDLAYSVPLQKTGQFYREFCDVLVDTWSIEEFLRHFILFTADFVQRNEKWARLFYLEIWPSVLMEQASIRSAIDDYANIVVEIIRAGARDGSWPPSKDPMLDASIVIGGISQLIITWLLYKKPNNLRMKAAKLVDRLLPLFNNRQVTA